MPSRPASLELHDEELRALVHWSAACARRVLELFEGSHPGDDRPRSALDAADAFAAGGRRTAALRRAGWAAFHAGRESPSPAAAAAAHAASHAAGAAFLHPLASAHQVRHVVGAAAHAALADEMASRSTTTPPAPPVVGTLLRRLPPAPDGGGRVGELMRELGRGLRG